MNFRFRHSSHGTILFRWSYGHQFCPPYKLKIYFPIVCDVTRFHRSVKIIRITVEYVCYVVSVLVSVLVSLPYLTKEFFYWHFFGNFDNY